MKIPALIATPLLLFAFSAHAQFAPSLTMTCDAQIRQKNMIDQRLQSSATFYSASSTVYICEGDIGGAKIVGLGDNSELALRSFIHQCEIRFSTAAGPGDCRQVEQSLRSDLNGYCKMFSR